MVSTSSTLSASAHVAENQPSVLQQILDPGVNLSLWQRPIQQSITRELSSLKAADLPDVRCSTSLDSFESDVTILLQQQGLDPMVFTSWRKDLDQIAEHYFGVSDDRDVTLRLVTTDGDDCPRYYVDRTNLRLLCTYQGPGTEWLANDQVDRSAQGSGAPNEEILRFGEPFRFEPFWVGILKGDAYPGNAGSGLVHRSPPVKDLGLTRVLFCLDC
jgi:hypothetical protein